ncbi:restriction endonuclease [Lysobacter tyrosinilyticus]
MTASTFLLAFALTAVIGGIATAWLWLVQRPRVERETGLKLLAAMRWREFSKLVIDGLASRGFQPEALEDAAERGQDSVIHLKRNGGEWLLACKQGLNYRVTAAVVGDMTDAVRFHGAAGGVVATPGTVDSEARKLAAGRLELFDGEALWPIVQQQLSAGVLHELAGKSRQAATRQVAIAWAAAVTVGMVAAVAMPKREPAMETVPVAAQADAVQPTPEVATKKSAPAATPVAPRSENEQRDEVIRMVSTLPGIERVMWSTKSTLLVYLTDENADPVRKICDVVEKYDSLRTSRLHLQPPSGSPRPARFLQCAMY